MEYARCILGYCAFNKCFFSSENYKVIFHDREVIKNFMLALTCTVDEEQRLEDTLNNKEYVTGELLKSDVNTFLTAVGGFDWKYTCDIFADDIGYQFLREAVGNQPELMEVPPVRRDFYAQNVSEPQ